MSSGRPPIVDLLRAATGSLHAKVEEAADVMGGDRARYVWFLGKQLGFLEPLERRLADAPGLAPAGIDLLRRERAHLFAADLLALGAHPAAVPRCPALPRVDSAARALGALYVLEGSTLAGIFLLAQVGRALGVTPSSGASGLAPYGPAVRDMWVAYTDALDRFVQAHPAEQDEIVDAARETFACMLEWLRAPEPATAAA